MRCRATHAGLVVGTIHSSKIKTSLTKAHIVNLHDVKRINNPNTLAHSQSRFRIECYRPNDEAHHSRTSTSLFRFPPTTGLSFRSFVRFTGLGTFIIPPLIYISVPLGLTRNRVWLAGGIDILVFARGSPSTAKLSRRGSSGFLHVNVWVDLVGCRVFRRGGGDAVGVHLARWQRREAGWQFICTIPVTSMDVTSRLTPHVEALTCL